VIVFGDLYNFSRERARQRHTATAASPVWSSSSAICRSSRLDRTLTGWSNAASTPSDRISSAQISRSSLSTKDSCSRDRSAGVSSGGRSASGQLAQSKAQLSSSAGLIQRKRAYELRRISANRARRGKSTRFEISSHGRTSKCRAEISNHGTGSVGKARWRRRRRRLRCGRRESSRAALETAM